MSGNWGIGSPGKQEREQQLLHSSHPLRPFVSPAYCLLMPVCLISLASHQTHTRSPNTLPAVPAVPFALFALPIMKIPEQRATTHSCMMMMLHSLAYPWKHAAKRSKRRRKWKRIRYKEYKQSISREKEKLKKQLPCSDVGNRHSHQARHRMMWECVWRWFELVGVSWLYGWRGEKRGVTMNGNYLIVW